VAARAPAKAALASYPFDELAGTRIEVAEGKA
jgi:hypothetical protein